MMVRLENHFNILFSSLSSKIALFQSVKSEAHSISDNIIVWGADSDAECFGSTEVTTFIKFPLLSSLTKVSLLNLCQKNNIKFVIPSRDGELSFWAQHKKFLEDNGIGVMVSSESAVKLCEDKHSFAEKLKNAPLIPIETFLSSEEIDSRKSHFVVKERYGSASRSIGLNLKRNDLNSFSKKMNDPIFQPQINGREFSAEGWIDQQGYCNGMVLRWRTKVVEGESHESITFKNSTWEKKLVETLTMINGLRGHILAQVIIDQNNQLHLVEVNPRLGGASPLSIASGLNSIRWSLLEFLGYSSQIPRSPIFKNDLKLIKKNGEVQIV